MGSDVCFIKVMAIIAGHQGNRQTLANIQQRFVDQVLLDDAVVLHF